MKDILEELVGNIFNEYDEEKIEYKKLDENTYMIEGSIPFYEFKKIIEIDIPEGDYDTLSGYLIEKLGRIPKEEDLPLIEDENLTYKIEQIQDKHIKLVKVCKNNPNEKELDNEEKNKK
jgi:putative hemolysin